MKRNLKPKGTSMRIILLVIAVVLFVLAALNVDLGGGNLVAAGLAFFAASFIPG